MHRPFRSHNDTCAVHQAVLTNNLDKLKILVEKDPRCLSCKNESRETPLLTAVIRNRNENVVQFLIDAGSDIHILNSCDRNVLHLAVMHYASEDIINDLLSRGSEVNLCDQSGSTPLHVAVTCRPTLVPMFLYYNVDVTIKNLIGFTPIVCSFMCSTTHCFDELINYYCEEDLKKNFTEFIESRYACFDMQNLLSDFHPQHFKIVWNYVDKRNIWRQLKSFLVCLLSHCLYENDDWLEILLMMLQSEIAENLVQDVYGNECFYFQQLVYTCNQRHIDRKTRAMLIVTFLSLGAQVHDSDMELVLNNYGNGLEFEYMIYAYSSCLLVTSNLFAQYLVNHDTDFSPSHTLQLFIRWITTITCNRKQKILLKAFTYFSLSQLSKRAILQKVYNSHFDARPTVHQLATIPEFPTLVELSRNAVRCTLIQQYNINCAYEVIDTVKMFPIPEVLKNIILFRKPIY
ncbi:hypothetical protein FQA39_LY10897 [Lamprigera yunnana]|nr:hypothetical protein FQA39_LY10897 [Lamprigera yunnana]